MTGRETMAVLAAVLLHTGFLGVARTFPGENLLLSSGPVIEAGLIWIEPSQEIGRKPLEPEARTEPREPERAPSAGARADETPPTQAPARQGRKLAAPSDAPSVEPNANAAVPESAGGTSAVAPQATSGATAAPNEGFSALEPEQAPSLGSWLGPSGWGIASRIAIEGSQPSAAPTETPKAKTIDGSTVNDVLGNTLIGQTRAKGIDLPGTQVVAGAVGSATRALPVPHNTRASFEVQLGPSGRVLGVRVKSSSGGDSAAWQAAAKSVAASLAKTPLDLGDAKQSGATIVVSVQVKHVYPTGSSKGVEVKPVCANQILNDIVDAADKKPAGPTEPVVPLFQDENGRPCIPVGVGGNADAANLGANKQIQVTTTTRVLIGGKDSLPTDIQPVNKDPVWLDTGKAGPRPVMPQKMRKYKRDREKKK